MLEPAHFLAFAQAGIARNLTRAAIAQMQQRVDKVQAYAGHQHCGHRHQHDPRVGGVKMGDDRRALVLTEQALDAFECNRVDVPGVAGEIRNALHPAIVRRMKAVIHGRADAQGGVTAVAQMFDDGGVADQVLQRVRKALGLKYARAFNGTAAPDDGVTGAGQHGRVCSSWPRTVFQAADKAVVQAAEGCLLGFVELQRGKTFPQAE